MASLSDLFSLVTLPRVSDIELHQKAVVSRINLTHQTVLDIGLSRSAICSYVLKPTPKLIWTYALSPSTVIDSIDVVESIGGAFKHFAVGLTERKSFKLMYLQKLEKEEEPSAEDQQDEEESKKQEIITRTIKTKSKVVGTRFSNSKDHVYAVLEDSSLQVFGYNASADTENGADEVATNLSKSANAKVVYHQFLAAESSVDGVLLIVEAVGRGKQKKTQVRLISLDLANTVEVKNVSLDSASSSNNTSKYTFDNLSNTLYALNDKELRLYTLPNFQLSKTISFAKRFAAEGASSLVSVAPDRLLIGYGKDMYIANTKYESILDEFSTKNSIYLQSAVHVKGKSLNLSETIAVYLSHDQQSNVSELNVLNVNVGLGTLSECLGKSITKKSGIVSSGVADLLEDNFVEQASQLTSELKEIYDELEDASSKQNLKKWERIVIPYLKGESWETIRKSIKKIRPEKSQQEHKKQTVAKDYEFKAFEVEKDRIVDYNFIHLITSLIFKVDEQTGDVCFKNTFIPEHSLTYLFTHPLYPKEFTNGLLLLFSRRAEEIEEEDVKGGIGSLRLLRQALITCPNLSCLEITKQLNNTNDEIFQDVVIRLIEEYSVNQISSTILQILNGTTSSTINLEECIKKCFILDEGWEIIPAIIDAGGLFGWSSSLIENILEDVESQLESLELNTNNLTFTNQAILVNSNLETASSGTVSGKAKKSKKKAKKEKELQKSKNSNSMDFDLNDIVESNRQQEQLNSILTINNTSRKNLLDDGISLSKKIPVYSIEKLVM